MYDEHLTNLLVIIANNLWLHIFYRQYKLYEVQCIYINIRHVCLSWTRMTPELNSAGIFSIQFTHLHIWKWGQYVPADS